MDSAPIPEWMRAIDPPLEKQLPAPEELRAMTDEQIAKLLEGLTRNSVTRLMFSWFLDKPRSRLVEACVSEPSVQDVNEGIVTPGALTGEEVGKSALYDLSVDVDYLRWWNKFDRGVGDAALRQWARTFAATALDSTRTFNAANWEPELRSILTHHGGDEYLGVVQGSYAYIEHLMYRARQIYGDVVLVEDSPVAPSVSFGVCSVHEAVYVNHWVSRLYPELMLGDTSSREFLTRILTIMRAVAEGREKWLKRHGRILLMTNLRAHDGKAYDLTAEFLRKGADLSDKDIGQIANRLQPREWDAEVRSIVNDSWRSRRIGASERARRLAGIPLQTASAELDPRISEQVYLAVLYEGAYTEDEMFIDH
jgi:hypothetical protein